MDRRERVEDLSDVLLAALQGWQTDIWTIIPGIVQSFDAVARTCTIQPSIRFRINDPALRSYKSATMIKDPSGQYAWDQLPLLLDCPVVFPGGGGVTLTFPIKVGDEVLVAFSSRCIDAWWKHGGIQNQAMVRMHDLSDGFVIPDIRSQPRNFTINTNEAQLRTDDGTVSIGINPTTNKLNIVSGAEVDVTAPLIKLTGNVQIVGNLTVSGTMLDAGVNVGSTHVHPVGAGTTGAPQ